MSEQMMQWTEDELIADYYLNSRLWGEADDPMDAKHCMERSQEIKEVAAARGIDLNQKYADRRRAYMAFTPNQLQDEYAALFKRLPAWHKPEAADDYISLEALFSAADERGIDLTPDMSKGE